MFAAYWYSCTTWRRSPHPHQMQFFYVMEHTTLNSVDLTFTVAYLEMLHVFYWGTRWRSWLRHCATNWKVAGSIPDRFTGIFQ